MTENLRNEKGARRMAGILFAAALLLGAGPVSAGSFHVDPVNIVLAPDKAATSVTMQNSASEPLSVRVLTYKWTQENGKDVYSPTTDVITSPPIFTIPGGGAQLVRIGLRSRTAGASYRVIFEEILPDKPSANGIQVALRLNLPLHVVNKAGEADVRWAALRADNGDIVLEARNQGSLHAQILEISATDAAGNKTPLSQEMGTVLPSSARHWKIGKHSQFTAGTPLLLTVRTAESETQTQVVVQSR